MFQENPKKTKTTVNIMYSNLLSCSLKKAFPIVIKILYTLLFFDEELLPVRNTNVLFNVLLQLNNTQNIINWSQYKRHEWTRIHILFLTLSFSCNSSMMSICTSIYLQISLLSFCQVHRTCGFLATFSNMRTRVTCLKSSCWVFVPKED